MTHHNATFLVLATDAVGISENGLASALPCGDPLFTAGNLIRSQVAECVDADRPLIVVVAKNKPRATAVEVSLYSSARDIVREAIEKLPETLHISVQGEASTIINTYVAPRVVSLPLPWATKNTVTQDRVLTLLQSLAFGDEGLELLPQGRTHVGA